MNVLGGKEMPKKKEEKVVKFKEKEVSPNELSQKEIEEVMKKDEEELNRYLKKFQTTPQPDSSVVQVEEDEEEETITLDFDKGTAYEKVEEGVAVRSEDGSINIVDGSELSEKIKDIIQKPEKSRQEEKYGNIVSEILVRKALASLLEKISKTSAEIYSIIDEARMGNVGNTLDSKVSDLFDEKRMELKQAFIGNKVNYERIPSWAESYVDEYVLNAIQGVVELTERD